jgi:4-alpha-glucanotransferase
MSVLSESEVKSFINSTLANQQWRRIGIKHHHGICLPLFSLRTERSAGIGEFFDLIPIIEWCSKIGCDIIQLLPLNDNGLGSGPYSSISAFALNPLHISLYSLHDWKSSGKLKELYKELQGHYKDQRINYGKILNLKYQFLKTYFEDQKSSLQKSNEFQTFKADNSWVVPYALFKTLKTKTSWASWQAWPDEWKNPSQDVFKKLMDENRDEIEFHIFLQLICYQQFSQVHKEASNHRVKLKGDIPILINKDSADVWEHYSIFNLNYSAGAPPDMYSPNGQDWGFPLYNWEAIEKEHYKWWIDRLKSASHYYDLYRLDHIVGFYRIWAINLAEAHFPRDFVPKDPHSWIEHGERILRTLLSNTEMLPIGEDLGTVPNQVRSSLRSLGISGTKVMRWERKWEEDKSYIPFNEYEPLSMTTVSTHDSETLKLWWKYNFEEAQEFARVKGWKYVDELSTERHQEILFDSHHTSSLFHINLLQEYLALLPNMTWPNPEDERINVPGTVSEKNWSYKFYPSVEEMVSHPKLSKLIKDTITSKN